MRFLFVLATVYFCAACTGRQAENHEVTGAAQNNSGTNTTPTDVDSVTIAGMPWLDSLVFEYCSKTTDETIKAVMKSGERISWLYDRMYQTDSTYFIVIHLGHDMEDHFATDGWVYVDTQTKSVYEYDVVNDSIYRWVP
ncbi:MAG TPA: hypothetical protein VEB40_15375 [Flavipsychrobacter sp.]|nr:hypothetical protein [Flavipsychrobacter sp.]